MDAVKLMRLLNGSMRYEFNGSILTITGYYSGDEVKLDLSRLSDEMLEELIVEDDE